MALLCTFFHTKKHTAHLQGVTSVSYAGARGNTGGKGGNGGDDGRNGAGGAGGKVSIVYKENPTDTPLLDMLVKTGGALHMLAWPSTLTEGKHGHIAGVPTVANAYFLHVLLLCLGRWCWWCTPQTAWQGTNKGTRRPRWQRRSWWPRDTI